MSNDDDELPAQRPPRVVRRGKLVPEDLARQTWGSTAEIRGRLSAADRLRGLLTVRRNGPASWTVDGPRGIAAVTSSEADGEIIACACSDLLYLLHIAIDGLGYTT